MDERSPGLILRTRPLTESSLIVHWLTPEFGRLSMVAKGARRAKSPFRGKLDLFYLADFTFHRSTRSELHSLREVDVRDFHTQLRRDLDLLQAACYFAQLLELTTETDTPLPHIFELACESLIQLGQSAAQAVVVFAFESKLLNQLGYQPDLDSSGLTPGSRALLNHFEESPWDVLSRLKLNAGQAEEIGRFLQSVWLYHFDRVPTARSAALHKDLRSAAP